MEHKKPKRPHKPQKHIPPSAKAVPPSEPASDSGKHRRPSLRGVLSNRVTWLDRIFGERVNDYHVYLVALTTALLCFRLISDLVWSGTVLSLAGLKALFIALKERQEGD